MTQSTYLYFLVSWILLNLPPALTWKLPYIFPSFDLQEPVQQL